MTALTQHFTLQELTASDTAVRLRINNTPTPQVIGELQKTAELLEVVRRLLGDVPLRVSSGYRCLDLNRSLRSSDTSAHIPGRAADFTAPGFGTPLEICRALANQVAALKFDQLIHEFNAWVHIGRADDPRQELLTIDNTGTRTGLF
jgi:hypothetical protein